MALEIKNQHLAFPHRLALESFVDGDASDQLGLGSVGLTDGLLKDLYRGLVHLLGCNVICLSGQVGSLTRRRILPQWH